MRIDAHHHVWDLAVRDQPWTADLPVLRRSFGFDELRPHLRAHRMDATVVVQTVCDAQETPELLALAAREPAVAGVVGWLDLTTPDLDEQIGALRECPGGETLVGLRHQVQLERDRAWLTRSDVTAGLRAAAAAGLVYDLLVTPDQLPATVHAVRATPDLRFVLDHVGKPPIARYGWWPWAREVRRLAREPNVAVKLSGLVTEADHRSWDVSDLRPYGDEIVERFGSGRVMFGSDWPVCLLAADYGRVVSTAETLTAALSGTERAQVFGATARSWYGLAAA